MTDAVYRGHEPEWASRKYFGDVASDYDAKRSDSPKWHAENQIITSMLDDIPDRSRVLDVPIGTGRFIPYYAARNFKATGVDVSSDMLEQSVSKIVAGQDIVLAVGDVRELIYKTNTFDAAVMCRLTRWLSPDDVKVAISELQRVSLDRVIFTARVRNHKYAKGYDLFPLGKWHIERDEPAGDEDYRVIMMRCDDAMA